jgi:hypothetical protein
MPDLHILLSARQPAFAVALPRSAETAMTAMIAKRPRSRAKERVPAVTVPATSVSSDALQIAQPHDTQLAAAHRVGIGVVTQSPDGSDGVTPGHDDTARPGLASSSGQSSTGHPSWASIAVGAAERLGSIDMDRDHDHH